MNKTSVDFLIDYHKRLVEAEKKEVEDRVRTKFKLEANKMVKAGMISNQDLIAAFKQLNISTPPVQRSVTPPKKSFPTDSDPCRGPISGRSSC